MEASSGRKTIPKIAAVHVMAPIQVSPRSVETLEHGLNKLFRHTLPLSVWHQLLISTSTGTPTSGSSSRQLSNVSATGPEGFVGTTLSGRKRHQRKHNATQNRPAVGASRRRSGTSKRQRKMDSERLRSRWLLDE